MATANTFVSAPSFVTEAGYDPLRDLVPVAQTAQIPMVLVTHPSIVPASVKALIDYAKGHPDELSFGSSGIGSTGYIAAELFARQAGIKLLSVPYKGNAQALADLVGGQVNIMFDQVSTSIPYINSQKLRPLAVTTARRSSSLPELPTIAEAGLPGYEDVTFNAILAPAGTPAAIVARLEQAIGKVLGDPAVQRQFAAQGIEAPPDATARGFGELLKTLEKRYRTIADAQTRR